MKKLLFLSVAFAVSSTALFAQSNSKKEKKQEEIIIEDNGSKNGTTIEIKNGEIFVDGKKVAEDKDAKDKNVKIFKQKRMFINGKEVPVDGNDNEEMFSFSPDGNDMGEDKPMLGVSTKPAKNNEGAEIEMITPNSPAQKLGLQVGDIITRINDKNILNPKDLVDAISTFKPGDMIDVTFDRNNKLITKNVKLSERNDDMMTLRRMIPFGDENGMGGFEEIFKQFNLNNNGFSSPLPSKAPAPKIGVSVEDRADGEGVLVNDVTENSAAEKAGLKKNDVITLFGTNQINNVDDLLDAISKNQSKTKIPLELKRNGTTKKLEIEIPKVLKKKEL